VAGSYRPNEHPRVASGLSRDNGSPDPARVDSLPPTWPRTSRARRELASPPVTEARIHIDSDQAIVEARRQARRLAASAGFKSTDLAIVATVISELARNMLLFAKSGDILVSLVRHDAQQGVVVVASDAGPGIADLSRALEDGYSTAGRLGLGLPGAKRLMDDFEITSVPGGGTTIRARKWAR